MPPSKRRKIDPPSAKLLNKSKGNKPASDGEASFHRFLDLPAELRNGVYSYAVLINKPIHLAAAFAPPITRVSKQVRAEALPVFFAENSFTVEVTSNIKRRTHIRDYNPSGPQTLLHDTTYCFEEILLWVESAERSGRVLTHRWLHKVPSQLVAFHDIKLTIVPAGRHRMMVRGMNDPDLIVRATREGAKVTIRSLHAAREDLLRGARISLRQIAEKPGFRGFSMEDLQMVADTFKVLPPKYIGTEDSSEI